MVRMNKLMNRLLKVLLVTLTMFNSVAFSNEVKAEESVGETVSFPSSIYVKQLTSDSCTLSAAAMMMRRIMYISGNMGWETLTETDIKADCWSSGLKWTSSTSYVDIFGYKSKFSIGHKSVSGITVDKLKTLIDAHPEGIVLHVSSIPHAVLITDYDSENIFYCADPSSKYAGKRIPLTSSLLGTKLGTQEKILAKTTAYWYLSGYSVPYDFDFHNPIGKVSVSSGIYEVSVNGYSYDEDDYGKPLAIEVYIGGDKDEIEPAITLTANKENDAITNKEAGNKHGFAATIKTDYYGTQPIYVYSLNSTEGAPDTLLLATEVKISRGCEDGDHLKGDLIHENQVASTCLTKGSYDEVYYCTACGKQLSRDNKTLDALGHLPLEAVKENVVEPTYKKAGGYDEVVHCGRCNEVLEKKHITVEAMAKANLDVNKLAYGQSATIVTNADGKEDVTFKSSNSAIASIDANGKITTKGFGKVKLSAVFSDELKFDFDLEVYLDVKVSCVSGTSLKVSWNKVAGASGYDIYRATSKNGTYKKVKSITKNSTVSFTDSKLKAGKTYYYKVVVKKSSTKLTTSAPVFGITLAKPAAKAARVSSTCIKISYGKISGAGEYEIYYSKDNKNFELLATTTSTSYKAENLTPAKTYYFKVRAVKKSSSVNTYGLFSNVVSAKTSLSTPVISLVQQASYNSLKVNWNVVESATAYKVYRATSKKGKYTLVATVNDATSYLDKKLTTGKTYYYKVVAAYGKSYVTAASAIKSQVAKLATPALTLKIAKGYITVNAKEVASASGYEIYRASSKSGKYTLLTTVTSLDYKDKSVKAGKTYYYKVRAYQIVNGKKYYSSYSSIKYGKAK